MSVTKQLSFKGIKNGPGEALTREEFGRLIGRISLGADKNFIDKLFWVFDEDGTGLVDHRELAVGIELLRENSFEEKLE